MIVLFTDFGSRDPYLGQVKAVLHAQAPGVAVLDLLNEVPDFNPHAGAHLLAALASKSPAPAVYLSVVDPGVGTPREGVVLEAAGSWFVGPDNGLLSVLAGRQPGARVWRILSRPEDFSDTFHGRDIFAPLAATLARGEFPDEKLEQKPALDVQFDTADLGRVIYIDHYGNAWTGLRASSAMQGARLRLGTAELTQARTYGDVARGEAFWYVNSVGLVEIAVNRGSAQKDLEVKVGDRVALMRLN